MTKKCLELFEKAKNNPKGLRFSELQKLCECAGMSLNRSKGSHFIYRINNPLKILPIQKMQDGKAIPYQVKQLLDFIEDNNLNEEEVKNA